MLSLFGSLRMLFGISFCCLLYHVDERQDDLTRQDEKGNKEGKVGEIGDT